MSMPTTALIVAGGRGTRLLPVTEHVPKPLLPFCGAPFLAGLARRLRLAGVRRVGLIVGSDTAPFEPLRALLAPHDVDVWIVPEPQPLDTAGGVRSAIETLQEPVLVLNGDVLSDLDFGALCAHHATSAATATIALTRVHDTSTFGVCVLEEDRITAFVEKPAPGALPGHDTVNAGAYVLAPGALAAFDVGPLSFEHDVFPTLLARGERLTGHVHEGVWTDLGTPERFLEGQRLVLDGVMPWPPRDDLEDLGRREGRPGREGVLVGRDVQIAGDVRFDPPVVIEDGVSIGSGAAIGPHVVLAASAHVGDRADVADALVGARALVGQRAVVSQALVTNDARVAAGAHVHGPVGRAARSGGKS